MKKYSLIARSVTFAQLFNLLALIACGGGITVQVTYDKQANFAGLQSYSFKETNDASATERRVRQAIQSELLARGYKEKTGGADFQVGYHAALQKKTIWQREYSARGVPAGIVPITFDEGTIAIQMMEPETGKVIWTGQATEAVNDQAQALDEIQPEVKKILARFPPR